MSTSKENLRKLADKVGNERVVESLELWFGTDDNLGDAQEYMLGVLHGYLKNHSPSEEVLREWYGLLGLTAEETKHFARRKGN